MSCEFISHRREVSQAMKDAKARALEAIGSTAERHVKEKLTMNRSVDTGNLRNSITHAKQDENTMLVGSSVKYAPYVELGHHQQPGRYVPAIKKRLVKSWVAPKPYLRPAIENHREEYKRIIRAIIGQK